MDPISKTTMLGAAGAGKESYWIAELSSGTTAQANSISVDSSGNSYVTGYVFVSGVANAVLTVKYDDSGVLQWQKKLNNGSNPATGEVIAAEGVGTSYVGIQLSSGNVGVVIAKYNSSGLILWQRKLDHASYNDYITGLGVDSSGNVYIGGNSTNPSGGANDFIIAKYNTFGALQWQRYLGGFSQEYGKGLAVDSSGNVYIVGRSGSLGLGGNDVALAKYNTSGTLQFQRALGTASNEDVAGVAVDSSGNTYVNGLYTPSNNAHVTVKCNVNGSILWQRTYGEGSGASHVPKDIAVDSSGNVYVVGQAGSLGIIIKYNASGVIQWQRTLANVSITLYGVDVDNKGNIYVSGAIYNTSTNTFNFSIAKLPDDGSLTGTYGSFTYASSSFPDGAGAWSDSASSMTNQTSSLTDSAATLTTATTSFTSSTTTL